MKPEQIRFKTAAGFFGHHTGDPDPNDPGMTEQEWQEWQKGVFLDALTPEKDWRCGSGDNRCACETPQECGYIAFYEGVAKL